MEVVSIIILCSFVAILLAILLIVRCLRKKRLTLGVRAVSLFYAMAQATNAPLSVAFYEWVYNFLSSYGSSFWVLLWGRLFGRSEINHLIIAQKRDSGFEEAVESFCSVANYKERLDVLTYLYVFASLDSKITKEEAAILEVYVKIASIYYGDYLVLNHRYYTLFEREEDKEQKDKKTQKEQQKNRANGKKRQKNGRGQNRNGQQEKEQNKQRRNSDTDVNMRWAYAALGIKEDASEETIRSAYRKRAMEYHPDKHVKEDEEIVAFYKEKFQHITEAYDLLVNNR